MSAAETLLILGQDGLWHLFGVFLRVGAMMALLPAFGERTVPARVRLGLALGFSLIVAPAAPALPMPHTPAAAMATLGPEVLAGLLMGIGLRLFVLALQTAGTMAAQATSLSQIFGGSAGADPMPAIAHLLTVAGLALAVMADLHVKVAALLIGSYGALPPGVWPAGAMVADWGVAQVGHAFALAFTLAAPFVVASVIYNVALGVVNRAMPHLMVTFVGAPALTWGALLLMLLALPSMLEVWGEALSSWLANPVALP